MEFSSELRGPDTGPRPTPDISQPRLESFVEACLSTAIGFVVSCLAWPVVAHLVGLPYSHLSNLAVTTCFTVLSVARAYIIRRWFVRRLRRTAHSLTRKLS